MKPLVAVMTVSMLIAAGASSMSFKGAPAAPAGKTLDIYFIDVEGGQATLIVTPSGQSLLVDAGYAGFGNRDPDRIMAAVRDAHVERLHYLLITHFHGDHAGGVPEIARRLKVKTFVDYGEPIEKAVFATGPFVAYKPERERARQRHPKPGDRLRLKSVELDVVSAGGALLTKPLPGAGQPNPACAGLARQPDDVTENSRSLGIRLRFGRFTFLDLGDLPGNPLAALACPMNLLGHADVYLVPHHGNRDTAIPAVVAAVTPRVAILNNGATKGGHAEAFTTLRWAAGIEDSWQLHKTRNPGAENFPDAFIANLEDGENDTGAWIKVSADESGTFTVTNGRTGLTRSYR